MKAGRYSSLADGYEPFVRDGPNFNSLNIDAIKIRNLNNLRKSMELATHDREYKKKVVNRKKAVRAHGA